MVHKRNEGRRRIRPHAWLVLLAAMAGTQLSFAAPAAASSMEQSLLAMTNQVRADQGLSALKWDPALAQAAQAHAQLLAQSGQLSHQYPGEPGVAARAAQAGAHFQSVAENIALGPGVDSIQAQWMKSMPHRANILDPTLNAIGFAVVERGQTLYAVADFGRDVPNLTLEQVEQAVGKLIAAARVPPTGPQQDARQTCEMSHGTAGGSSPRFVMRWQSSDLTQLPPALVERLRSGQFHSAAVGACASANAESGFTTYRVAVLLY